MTIEKVLSPGTTIEVTEDDIYSGRGGSPTCCAVALAVKRLIPEDCYAYVVTDWMEIVRRGEASHRIDLPYRVGEFIRHFDRQCEYEECETEEEYRHFWEEHGDGEPFEVEKVEPFKFEIPVGSK